MPQIITLSTDAQLREAIAVHHAIHGNPVPIWEDLLYRHPRWSAPGAHRAIIDDGRIVALTSVAMWEHRIGDTTLPAAEIGLVGTLPDHRGRGHSRRLMESWLATMREARIPLSFLTGIPGFYERWAYHYAVPDHANHFMSIGRVALEQAATTGARLRPTNPKRDIPDIADLIATEMSHTPAAPVLDAAVIAHFLERAEVHGVDWLVAESPTGEVSGVLRMVRWAGGTGMQRPGAVTLAAARDDARGTLAAAMLRHLDAGDGSELPLAIAPHAPFATWLYHRGASRRSDRATYPGAYATMVRVNDLPTVLEALRGGWGENRLADRFAGTAITLRTGSDEAQVATIEVTNRDIAVHPGPGGVEIDAPPAVTVPRVTGWRSAADWLDGTPYPPLLGPAFDPGNPATLPPDARDLLCALFPARHPYIGDTIQGA